MVSDRFGSCHPSAPTRAVLTLLCASLALPAPLTAQAALPPLNLSQVPPASTQPPAPNIIVTLDDSGSMAAQVNFDASQTYPVPPGPDGNPLRAMPAAPQTYNDGYTASPNPVNMTGVWLNAYNALPTTAQKDAYRRWFAFYRTRILAMRGSVMNTFSPTVIPDGKVRLAWQGLGVTCSNGFPATNSCTTSNAMWPLDNVTGGRTHRTNFFNWVRSVPAAGGTPLRAAFDRAGTYLQQTGVNSPWAHLPGNTLLPEVSCRRSYQVVFTDGGWNGAGPNNNEDNTNRTFPDGTAYTQQRPYRGPDGNDGSGTLSDVSFKYWATDLQTGANFQNDLRPIMTVATPQTFGSATVSPYWNPANNPATWQHMVTYAIGFGEAAAITDPLWSGSSFAGANFAGIVDGSRNWPAVNTSNGLAADLWHAAVNSRGRMFTATDQSAVNTAFQSILGEIISQNVASGGAASSFVLSGANFRVVRAGYTSSPTLRGTLEAYGLNTTTGAVSNLPAWEGQAKLAALSDANATNRVVLTASGPTTGAAFRWNSLGTYQKTELNKTFAGAPDTRGALRVDYLRGDTLNELSPGNTGADVVFRWRQGALLGTNVNAEPKIVQAPRSGYPSSSYRSFRTAQASRTPVVYLGANDGMLHGFNALTGAPVLSYVPRGVFPNLAAYSDPAFTHRMYVDGPIITGDYLDGQTWKTILVGALGAGGRGIFALDITTPANFTEANAASLVKFDYTAPATSQMSSAFSAESGTGGLMDEISTDMGHIVSDPARDAFIGRSLQIAQMRNGKWALVMGNGVNSENQRAALYIIYLDGSGYKKLLVETELGQGNGLSTPLPVDADNDGLVDLVYAGDLRGRLWKFDLSSSDDANWKAVQVSGVATPLIDTGRPITAAPAVAEHPSGGLLVTFGTGRALTEDDRSSTTTESIYGIWDKPGGPHAVTASDLVARSLSGTTATTTGGNVEARVLAGAVTAVDYGTKRGWKMDLGLAKERIVFNPIVQGRLGYYSTFVPATSSACAVIQTGSLLAFDVIAGNEPATPVLDINGDGSFSTADRIANNKVIGRAAGVGRLIGLFDAPPPVGGSTTCAGDSIIGSAGQICARRSPGPGRRLWREMRP